jgi:hypothetical protein
MISIAGLSPNLNVSFRIGYIGRLLTIAGALVTAVYSILIVWLMDDRVTQLTTMPLNELGDFFAGVFGPLAIFWVILGVLQQGKELNSSVKQQKQLVEVSRQQVEAANESMKYERQRQAD